MVTSSLDRERLMAVQDFNSVVFAALLCLASVGCARTSSSPDPERSLSVLRGAGATFPAPLYKQWLDQYRAVEPGVTVTYEPVGSGEGVRLFVQGRVDFGASDAAMSDAEMAKVGGGVQLVPTAAGSIVLAYNLPGVESQLRLRRETYTDIFLGKIKDWDDARIRADNPDVDLPHLSINIAARRDSSGTTYAFTNHLSAISPTWRDHGPGIGKVIDWPGSAMLAAGNEGVATLVQRFPGMIGYVEFGIAERAGLSMATLENRAGNFVAPSHASGEATLAVAELPGTLRAFFPDPQGAQAYPIVTLTWMLLYREYEVPEKASQLKQFVHWCLTDGQQFNASLGFLPLPTTITRPTLEAVAAIQ